MACVRCEIYPIDIRLNTIVPTGAGGVSDRGGLVVRVEDSDGVYGYGEASRIPGDHTSPSLELLATQMSEWCAKAPGREIAELLVGLDAHSLASSARFAIHTALADLDAKRQGVSLSKLWSADAIEAVPVNALVANESPKDVHETVTSLVQAGLRAIKLKVGVASPALDVTRIIAASEAAGNHVELRLDANRAWTLDEAIRVVGRVGKHRISYLEDPVVDLADFARVSAETGVRVALDVAPSSWTPQEQIERSGVDLAVVKLSAVGGADRLLALNQEISDACEIIVSTSIDQEIAHLAAVHVAAALGDPLRYHGLATAGLVQGMPESLDPVHGEIAVPAVSGLGYEAPSVLPAT